MLFGAAKLTDKMAQRKGEEGSSRNFIFFIFLFAIADYMICDYMIGFAILDFHGISSKSKIINPIM